MFKGKRYSMVKNTGKGSTALGSFDNALMNSGVGNFNLLKVSSILPPNAKEEKTIEVADGSLLPIAYGSITSFEKGKLIAAGVGVGIPKNKEDVGVIMEHSTIGDESEIEIAIEEMVKEAMENRKIEIDEIKVVSSYCTVSDEFNTAFAGIAIW